MGVPWIFLGVWAIGEWAQCWQLFAPNPVAHLKQRPDGSGIVANTAPKGGAAIVPMGEPGTIVHTPVEPCATSFVHARRLESDSLPSKVAVFQSEKSVRYHSVGSCVPRLKQAEFVSTVSHHTEP